MGSMFYKYNNLLEELIIPDWDMTNVTSSSSFFHSNTPKLRLIDLSRSNDTTITKIASYLPTRTATTFGEVMVPSNTSQVAYDALIAKYWRPLGADLTPVPTSIEIISELDELIPGKPRTTRVYLNNWDPWYADTSKIELVMTSDSSIATIEGDTITSTGITGDIVLEVRIIDTQEVIGTKTIPVTETDSYPNEIKLRLTNVPSYNSTVITVNGSDKKLSDLTYDSIFGIYSYDAGAPITSIKFNVYLRELVKLNTSNITSMDSMFSNCEKLTTLDLSNWDTRNITSMDHMFSSCYNLTSLDISNFDTSNITIIYYMFHTCSKLHTLHLDNCSNDTISKIITSSGFPTNVVDGVIRTIYCKESEAAGLTPPTNWVFSYITEEEPPVENIPLYVPGEFQENTEITEVRTMVDESHDDLSYMFYDCTNLVSVNTEDWGTSNVINMTSMFSGCTSLTQLNLSNFDTSNLSNMDSMFYCCTSLTTLDLSNWDTTSIFSLDWDMRDMFYNCSKLHTLRLDNCSNDTINNIITSHNFPTNTIEGQVRTIYCKEENAAGLTPPKNWVFEYIEAEPEIPDNTIVVYTVNDANKTALTYVQPKAADWEETVIDNEDGTYTVFATGSELPGMLKFNGNTALVSVSYINTSAMTTVGGMFGNCTGLINLDLSNFDVNNIQVMTSINSMLQGCTGLQTLRLENCTNNTISKIITSSGFPIDNYGTIYCRESEAAGLTPPGNWVFSYIEE
jgi:surface protein